MTTDVCLVSNPALERAKSPVVPHWILWLAGHLERGGHVVGVADVKSDPAAEPTELESARVVDETLERLRGDRPRWVGLSGFTEEFHGLVALARRIREVTGARIVVGGAHATVAPEDYFVGAAAGSVDVAVVGDGETPLSLLLSCGDAGPDAWSAIPGLVYADGGRLVRTPGGAAAADLSPMGPLPYHLLDGAHYFRPQQMLTRWVYLSGVHVFTARGCPYRCTFCANSGRRVRYRPLEAVVAELSGLKESHGIDGFYIHDDTFAIRTARVLEFCSRLRDSGLRFAWGMEGRVDQLPDEVCAALRASGCIQVDFGVESGSQAALDRMCKGTTVADAEGVFDRCRRHGLRTFANFLLNTPGETAEDIRQTERLMERLRADAYGICLTTPYPGTQIYARHVVPPLAPPEYRLYEGSRSYSRIVDPRFRLGDPEVDVEREYARLCAKYMAGGRWKIATARPAYLRALLSSRRKGEYARLFAFRFGRRLRTALRGGGA